MKKLTAFFMALMLIFTGLTAEAAFSDVKSGDWFAADVGEMEAAGLIKGYEDNTFRPGGNISRAEFITISARILGIQRENSDGYWAEGNIEALRDAGCWPIWSFTDFDGAITREEAAAVAMLSLLPEAGQGDWNSVVSRIADFESVAVNYQYLVERAYANGVLNGYEDSTFRPGGAITRAEAAAVFKRCIALRGGETPELPDAPDTEPEITARKGGVSENGWLQVKNARLCNEKGEPVLLHGMSSHGIQWYGSFCSSGAISTTADYGANVFRVAMYVGEGGYLQDMDGMRRRAFAAADAAIANDMYVILDWHILNGDTANPKNYQAQAIAFFKAAAERYKNTPNVLYELCNEPNGNVSWERDVRPYAQAVTDEIRSISARSIVLVGSPTWSQDVDVAAALPVDGENIMYTCHFYAGTHGESLRQKILRAKSLGAAVFVTEWGASDASGNGGPYLDASRVWLDFMAENGISWCNWSLCDKNETSAALKSGADPSGGWTAKDLTASGKLVFSNF